MVIFTGYAFAIKWTTFPDFGSFQRAGFDAEGAIHKWRGPLT